MEKISWYYTNTKGVILIYIDMTVDKTEVAGSEVFVYTVKLAFEGLSGEFVQGTAEVFFPDTVVYSFPPLSSSLTAITPIAEKGGTRIVFQFENAPVETTMEFSMSGYFGPGRRSGESYTSSITLYQEGSESSTATAETVTLTLVGDWYLAKYFSEVLNPKVGESFPCHIELRNKGDAGATLSDILISDPLPSGLVADTSVIPTGMDVSDNFPDTSQDGLTGTWANSALYFPLSEYSGEVYRIDFQVQIDSRVAAGTTIDNVASYTVASVDAGISTASITTYIDKAEVDLLTEGSYNATVGGAVQYEVSQKNTGTVALTDYVLYVDATSEIALREIAFYSYNDSKYSLSLLTISGTEVEIGSYSGNSGVIALSDYSSEQVQGIYYKTSVMEAENSTERMMLSGTVLDTAEEGSTLNFTSTVKADSSLYAVAEESQVATLLTGESVLQVEKYFVQTQDAYYALDEIWVLMKVYTYGGQVVEPVFADLLPESLGYLTGQAYFVYYDALTETYLDSRSDEMPFSEPVETVLENYVGEQTLLRFTFEGYTMPYGDSLEVYFPVIVKIGASSFENFGYLGNLTGAYSVWGDSTVDTLDLIGDGDLTKTIAMTAGVSAVVLYNNEFKIDKSVMGDLDSGYSSEGMSTEGGTVKYLLEVMNNQDAVLSNLVVVDILPYVGDTGVIVTGTERGSEFSVYLAEEVTGEVLHLLTGERRTVDLEILYSTSTDPVRMGSDGSEIGVGDWTAVVPEDLGSIVSVKVTMAEELNSYEVLQLTLVCTVPVGTTSGELAYNSFSMGADLLREEVSSSLLPTESSKVSVEVVSTKLASVGGFVWLDSNEDGVYDQEESGYNGVTVELYDGKGNLLGTTVTASDTAGAAGYYLFGDLGAGTYQLKFVPSVGVTLTVQNLEADLGSKPDSETGLTEYFDLLTGEALTDMDAGVIVDEEGLREQAISDLITSIALEEAGIRGILDAEGAKIQQAVALDLTQEEMLAVNASVTAMVEAITELELVLVEKLKLVTGTESDE